MSVRPIRVFGDPVLRAASAPIVEIDDGIRALVRDLVETVELPGRAGLAAPQIGVGLRAFSYNIDGDIGYVLNPVLVDDANQIIAGHGRLEAAKSLGFKSVPCLRIDHLSQDEKRAYIIADNRLAEKAGWDRDLLAGVRGGT